MQFIVWDERQLRHLAPMLRLQGDGACRRAAFKYTTGAWFAIVAQATLHFVVFRCVRWRARSVSAWVVCCLRVSVDLRVLRHGSVEMQLHRLR